MRATQWMTAVQKHWESAFPRCRQTACGSRRMWRQVYRQDVGIRLDGHWYCSPQCFEIAARQSFQRALVAALNPPPIRHRIPLGLVMLSRGQLTNRQLRMALEAQQTEGRGRIGHWLTELGFATEQQVTVALGLQWSCPVLSRPEPRDSACAGLLPFPLLENFRMLPVEFVNTTRTLYLAFCQGVEYVALCAIEHILGCHTEACLVSDSVMKSGLQQIEQTRRTGELLFESCRNPAEMARVACGYALKLGVGQVRLARCGRYLWTRLELRDEHTDLLFRIPPGPEGAEHSRPQFPPKQAS